MGRCHNPEQTVSLVFNKMSSSLIKIFFCFVFVCRVLFLAITVILLSWFLAVFKTDRLFENFISLIFITMYSCMIIIMLAEESSVLELPDLIVLSSPVWYFFMANLAVIVSFEFSYI